MRRPEVDAAAEDVARASFGRLVAYLTARTRNIAAAEDALSDAFRAALETWPERGIPEKPEAWLMRAARNVVLDHQRHEKVVDGAADTLALMTEELSETRADFPDERLKLLFVCAHPAIDEAVRTPLMLQIVMGLDAARIASAFLTAPATMGQRLVRAKTKIKIAGIAFEIPERENLSERLEAVLDAIYAAFGIGWDDAAGADPKRRGLSAEAIWLARLVVTLLPDAQEAKGLLSLMLYSEARRGARRDRQGAYVPLSEQDVGLWDRALIREAERHLHAALDATGPGRYCMEAAIQSAHVVRLIDNRDNWREIAALYDKLIDFAPTMGALVSRAAALSEAFGPRAGLDALAELPKDRTRNYQPYWAVRAAILARTAAIDAAAEAYTMSIGLTEDVAVRRYLLTRKAQLSESF